MSRKIAIVIGGAQNVWDEVYDAQQMCKESGVKPVYFVCNDMIETFIDQCICCTLHVDKLPTWLANRERKGMIMPREVWTCTQEAKKPAAKIFATHYMDDFGGSSGLFMCRVAITHYGLKVILCGVPMTAEGGHFVRRKPWNDVVTFTNRWKPHIYGLLNGKVRSWSGKTKEWFGEPTTEFFLDQQEA